MKNQGSDCDGTIDAGPATAIGSRAAPGTGVDFVPNMTNNSGFLNKFGSSTMYMNTY